MGQKIWHKKKNVLFNCARTSLRNARGASLMSTGINNGRGCVTTCSHPAKMSSSKIQKKTVFKTSLEAHLRLSQKLAALESADSSGGLYSGLSLHRKFAEAPAVKLSIPTRGNMQVQIQLKKYQGVFMWYCTHIVCRINTLSSCVCFCDHSSAQT